MMPQTRPTREAEPYTLWNTTTDVRSKSVIKRLTKRTPYNARPCAWRKHAHGAAAYTC